MKRRPHLQEGDVILTGRLRLQRRSPLRQLAKLLLQAVHHPLPLCHHSLQLGHDPAHHVRPDLVQRVGQVVQREFNLAALSVSMALKHRRVQMVGEKRATTPSSSTRSTHPATFLTSGANRCVTCRPSSFFFSSVTRISFSLIRFRISCSVLDTCFCRGSGHGRVKDHFGPNDEFTLCSSPRIYFHSRMFVHRFKIFVFHQNKQKKS